MTSKLDTAGLVERMDNRITQKYLRRYPNSKRTRSWAGVPVHIETEIEADFAEFLAAAKEGE